MLITNTHPDHLKPLASGDAALLGAAGAREVERFLAHRENHRPTPLHALPALARQLDVAAIHVKDEGQRLGLGSFKALGGGYAVVRLVLEEASRRLGRDVDVGALAAPDVRAVAAGMTFGCATDGNHGRSVAQGAQLVGARAAIFVHGGVSAARVAAIARFGAEVIRVDGTYDDSVREAARVCDARGWTVVSDTSWPGYERIPGLVMQGYTAMAREALAALPQPPTHVFLQAGVGGLAAAVAAHLALSCDTKPTVIVVEPARAACLYESAKAGRPITIPHQPPTVMAMLECYEPSLLAWRILAKVADAYMTVDEDDAVAIMNRLARPAAGDPAIVAGESGGVGLAGLVKVAADPASRAAIGLDSGSRALAIITEGATDPARYRELVGLDPAAVAPGDALMTSLSIDGARLLGRVQELGRIGCDAQGRLARLAATDADKAGRDQVVAWMKQAGLRVVVDRIGNIFGIWRGENGSAPVMLGSHIDTVLNGGIYDGNYGVLAGLEVIETLQAAGVAPARPIVVAAFTNEEGARYAPDMLGSLVYVGGVDLAAALATVGTDGTVLGQELARIGYAGDAEPGFPTPHAYLELHIEQGPVLEREGLPIGVVETLQGISWQRVTIEGTANHAGTTPMALRRDAGHAAARVMTFVHNTAIAAGPHAVATVGSLKLEPNIINVIASRATFTVDLRDPDEGRLQAAEAALARELDALAAREGVRIAVERLARFEPVIFDDGICRLIEAAAEGRQLAWRRMTSGAGHDAQMLARLCPSAMIFVPSRGGISHNPREHTEPAELVAGANVFLDVVTRLCGV